MHYSGDDPRGPHGSWLWLLDRHQLDCASRVQRAGVLQVSYKAIRHASRPHGLMLPFSYFGGCDRQGATCNSADCLTAFFNPNDNQVQVQCETTNVRSSSNVFDSS